MMIVGLTPEAQLNLSKLLRQTLPIDGEIAELGVASGSSAELICLIKGEKMLHLFDTFTGLPELSKEDEDSGFMTGMYAVNFEKVKEYFDKNFHQVQFHKGLFQETKDQVKDRKFSFVHLDADLYKSTLEGLQFFWPRLNPGGIILLDDFKGKAIRKALIDYPGDQLKVQEIAENQVFLIKE